MKPCSISSRLAAPAALWLSLWPFLAGCEITVEPPAPSDASAPHVIQVPPAQAAVVGKGVEIQDSAIQAAAEARTKKQPSPENDSTHFPLAQNEQPGQRRGDGSGAGPAKAGLDLPRAFQQVTAEIRDSLALRNTLVVWLVEQSVDAGSLPGDAAEQIVGTMKELAGSAPNRLEMAVISYGAQPNLLTAAPLSNVAGLRAAASTLKEKQGDVAEPFAALKLAVENFLAYRNRGYEVLFVVVGGSSGTDLSSADATIDALKRAAIPTYGIGPAIPFVPSANRGGAKSARAPETTAAPTGKLPSESLAPERIQLTLSGGESAADLNDSGFGPFGLERICRLTGGAFFRLHPGRPAGWNIDPATADIKLDLLDQYSPDYVSLRQYEQLLAENKCRQALHNAAELPPTEGLESVRTDFPKEKDEAALARTITTAQRAAADRDQPLQKMYDTLMVGEAARPKLTGPRWQAAYDLALGQTLAAKARLDGYNAMLAILKQGKAFTNADSKRWVLEPADEIAASSVLDKMAKKSRTYLEQVVKEHPGTPWAAMAQRELRHPAGWKFVEK